MSSVALNWCEEKPWTHESGVRFVNLLGYREITLKSDAEPALFAFGKRVENCAKKNSQQRIQCNEKCHPTSSSRTQ